MTTVPVWARIYKPEENKIHDPDFPNLLKQRPEFQVSSSSSKQHNTAPTPSQPQQLNQMPPSIANVLPIDDLCKVLASWVYNHLEKLESDLLPSLEVEFKLGLISDPNTHLRHKFPGLSECVVDPNYWSYSRLGFRSDVDPADFKMAERLMESIVPSGGHEIANSSRLIKDEMYECELEKFGKCRVRVSTDELGNLLELIYKQRLGDLFISAPNAKYDIKMTMSVEHKLDKETVLPALENSVRIIERNKNRLSYASEGCTCDLSAVNAVDAANREQQTKEIEIEANGKRIADSILQAREKRASLDPFFEVIRYTIDSARYLTRNI